MAGIPGVMDVTAVSAQNNALGGLLPRTAHGPGQQLWGEAPRKQPIAPLILMAVVLLIVAAPSALAGGGGSSNPMTIMKHIADSTYDLTGLMQESNESLQSIDENSAKMAIVQKNLVGIGSASAGMADKTTKIDQTMGGVATSVRSSRAQLGQVDDKLSTTAKSLGQTRSDINGSLKSTNSIVTSFKTIGSSIGAMDSNLKSAIAQMATSAPLTQEFANNRTRVAIAGGKADKYKVPNFAPDARVMSIVLPMIKTMQDGGKLPARKDSHQASNPLIGTILKLKVPDGTNVVANVIPYDGFYGLPGPQFFVDNRIHGF
jgi:hypothetical protein